MLEENYIYGVILLSGNHNKAVEVIRRLKEDVSFPNLNTRMFSLGAEFPIYHENPIISFGATYRQFGYDIKHWKIFILKIEHILRSIDFESAQFHFASEIGDYTLFWKNIDHSIDELYSNYSNEDFNLVKTDEWYFGYGIRNLHLAKIEFPNKMELNLDYPFQFNKDVVKEFVDRI